MYSGTVEHRRRSVRYMHAAAVHSIKPSIAYRTIFEQTYRELTNRHCNKQHCTMNLSHLTGWMNGWKETIRTNEKTWAHVHESSILISYVRKYKSIQADENKFARLRVTSAEACTYKHTFFHRNIGRFAALRCKRYVVCVCVCGSRVRHACLYMWCINMSTREGVRNRMWLCDCVCWWRFQRYAWFCRVAMSSTTSLSHGRFLWFPMSGGLRIHIQRIHVCTVQRHRCVAAIRW